MSSLRVQTIATYALPKDSTSPHSAIERLLRGNWNWKSRGAVIGLCGGFGAPILGVLMTVLSWFTNQAWHGFSLRTAGTFLFFLAIPLLVLGAHCLDLLEQEKHR